MHRNQTIICFHFHEMPLSTWSFFIVHLRMSEPGFREREILTQLAYYYYVFDKYEFPWLETPIPLHTLPFYCSFNTPVPVSFLCDFFVTILFESTYSSNNIIMIIALTEFHGLCGFRPYREVADFLIKIPELKSVVGVDESSSFITACNGKAVNNHIELSQYSLKSKNGGN